MSKYEQKNGTGTVWKNEKYVKGGNQPYARGTILDLDGNELELTLWVPHSEKVKGFNVTLQEPYKEKSTNSVPEKNIGEDSLPF